VVSTIVNSYLYKGFIFGRFNMYVSSHCLAMSYPTIILRARHGNGVEIPCSRQGPALHWGKIPAPNEDGHGDRDQSSSRNGDEDGGQFSPCPCPCPRSWFLALRDIPVPVPIPIPAFPSLNGEKSSSLFLFLDFSWIILCDLCTVKLVLHGLLKL